ncbi:MAG TPA: citrate lyase subunit alpha [Spirochaetia bacterium]|nr:citrate lyase subunit alpha [Spirochaetia bacterium]
MGRNAAGREIPENIPGFEKVAYFEGAYAHTPLIRREKGSRTLPRLNKLVDSIEVAIEKTGLKDGMTISFHHHFREGDVLVNRILDIIAGLGIKNLTLASSSLTTVHAPLIEHIKKGVIRKIVTSGLRGELADAISHGLMDIPVLIHSHGGRARAVESGQLEIDVAFLGVPSCDLYGNANGFNGKSACGSLGYAIVDARNARKVVMVTDHLTEYPNTPFSIDQDHVDHIVVVDSVGDPGRISVGATRMTQDPRELLIARMAADSIAASGYFEDGFSFQTGSGGAALAVTKFLREKMIDRNIKASFVLGGITSQIVKLHEEGLVKRILDVQSFDLDAIRSIGANRHHTEIDASYYANPLNKGCVVNKLNVVVLSAMEVDIGFNVNVITGSDGVIRGASGGHSDTAIGSGLSVIVAPLVRGRTSTIVDSVTTVITPGESVDVLVTDHGIAVNPRRPGVAESLKAARLPIYTIEELKAKAEHLTGTPEPIRFGRKIVGLVEYRDGTIVDVIREVE